MSNNSAEEKLCFQFGHPVNKVSVYTNCLIKNNTFHLSDPPERTTLTTSAASNTAVKGNQVTFTCKVKRAKPTVDKYKFYFKNSNRPIAENSKGTYQINSVKASDQGTYKCVPHNDAGDGENATVMLTVNGKLWTKYNLYLKN